MCYMSALTSEVCSSGDLRVKSESEASSLRLALLCNPDKLVRTIVGELI